MKDCGQLPMQGLAPAERAVKYILDVLPGHPELSWYLGPGTEMFRLLCDAEAQRLGFEPDPDYKPGLYPSRFAEDYAKRLSPKRPRCFLTCPECGWEGEEDI